MDWKIKRSCYDSKNLKQGPIDDFFYWLLRVARLANFEVRILKFAGGCTLKVPVVFYRHFVQSVTDKKLQRLLSSLLDKVSWFHGSKSFGCGRKYQNIKLADSCTESDSCDVIVGLYIFNPTLQDAGYYKMSIVELGLESSLHKLEVDNGKISTRNFRDVRIFEASEFSRIRRLGFDDLTDKNFRWNRIHQKCKLNRYGNFGKNSIIGINFLSWN